MNCKMLEGYFFIQGFDGTSKALNWLLKSTESERIKFKIAASKLAEENFTWKKIGAKWQIAYENILNIN